MSISNPSHRLISRNPPRSPAHPQLAHASSSRHTQTASLPPTIFGTWTYAHPQSARSAEDLHAQDALEDGSDESGDVEEVDIHSTFRPDAMLPGRVKVIVGKQEFWCHKEVLWFASPFFQGLLQGK